MKTYATPPKVIKLSIAQSGYSEMARNVPNYRRWFFVIICMDANSCSLSTAIFKLVVSAKGSVESNSLYSNQEIITYIMRYSWEKNYRQDLLQTHFANKIYLKFRSEILVSNLNLESWRLKNIAPFDKKNRGMRSEYNSRVWKDFKYP